MKKTYMYFFNILSVIIIALLTLGLYKTYPIIFTNNGESTLNKDPLVLYKYYIITFILIIQFLFLITIGKVKNKSMAFCLTFTNNVIVICLSIYLCKFFAFVYHCFVASENFFVMFPEILKNTKLTLFWPDIYVCSNPQIFSVIIFALLCLFLIISAQYGCFKKYTEDKKLLFIAVSLSSLICYSAVSLFFYFKY